MKGEKINWKCVVSLVALSCLVLACAGEPEQIDHPRIVVARNHVHAFHLLAPAVAQEKGFFENVTVEIFPQDLLPEMAQGDELLRVMRENSVDVVLDGRSRAVFNQSSPEDGLCIIGGWTEGGNEISKLVATRDIASLSDLKGKKVGTSGRDSNTAATLRVWLFRAGIDPDQDITWVDGLPRASRAPEALLAGEVDAAVVSREKSAELEEQGYSVLLDYEELYPEGHPQWAMVATWGQVRSNPQAVKGFLKGMVRAYRLINDWQNHEDFLKDLSQRLVEAATDPAGETYENTRLLNDAMISTQALQQMLDEEIELGQGKEGVSLDSVVHLTLLEEALAELRNANSVY